MEEKVKQIPIFFPIETLNRELDFRLLMAVVLADQNFIFYIGQHDLVFATTKHCSGGVYVGKNIFLRRSGRDDGHRLKELKSRSIGIVYLHEEGAVFAGREDNWKSALNSQYDINLFSPKDVVCVWGKFQAEHDRSRAVDKNLRIVVTGHPRFDLYKPNWSSFFAPERDRLIGELKAYVLISGNYGVSNHGIGLGHIFSDAGNYNVIDPVARLKRVGFYSYTARQQISIVELVHNLAVRFPELNFVFRAHPSENEEYYKIVFNGVKNIIVRRDGPIGGWILGAKALIHDGCSTAVEAWLAEVPVINFKPFDSEEHQIFLPNQIGIRAKTEAQVENALVDILSNKSASKFEVPPDVKDLFENFVSDSVERFREEVLFAASAVDEDRVVHPKPLRIQLEYLKESIKVGMLKIYSLFDKEKAKKLTYHQAKYYGFDKPVIAEKIKRLETITGKRVKWHFLNERMIIIEGGQ